MAKNKFVPTKNLSTWDTISDRLNKFSPSIALADYIDFTAKNAVRTLDYTSDGINFVVAKDKRDELLRTLRSARTQSGKQAFEGGQWKGALHAAKGAASDIANSVTGGTSKDAWALNISYAATKGIGFREIWRLELTDRQLRLQNVRDKNIKTTLLDSKFSSQFNAPNSIDLSSLHWAIGEPDPKTGRSECNLHIDQVGIAANLAGGTALTPDVGYHTLVELAFRTGLKGLVPDKVLQGVDFILPSSRENYALNFGMQIKVIDRKNLRLSLRGMCSVHNGGCEWSGTINLSGIHNIFGSK
ncbi:MAG: hypothetical protein H6970_13755 [Gammaproteobacteria bacterium]|nr:hypothetical protein [Gammaproteobacteria bacterium]MCP5426113.1 hypothetical protein [Gammaproteobacteria bacterium]MCP5460004.1 hypothetical protein [Gammaproteobacteria bacterium]